MMRALRAARRNGSSSATGTLLMYRIPRHLALGSLPFSWFVLAWVTRPNERVRPGLDGVRKFFEILAHVPQVFEQLIDIVGVHGERQGDSLRSKNRHDSTLHWPAPTFSADPPAAAPVFGLRNSGSARSPSPGRG